MRANRLNWLLRLVPEGFMKATLSVEEKYRQLKAQTEAAGMTVKEKDGKIIVSRKKVKKKNG